MGCVPWRNMKRIQVCAWETSLKLRLSNQKRRMRLLNREFVVVAREEIKQYCSAMCRVLVLGLLR